MFKDSLKYQYMIQNIHKTVIEKKIEQFTCNLVKFSEHGAMGRCEWGANLCVTNFLI